MKIHFDPKNELEAQELMSHFLLSNLYNPIRVGIEPKLKSIKGSTIKQQKQFAEEWRHEMLSMFGFVVYVVPQWKKTGRAYVGTTSDAHGNKFSQYDDNSNAPIIYINAEYIINFLHSARIFFRTEYYCESSNSTSGFIHWNEKYPPVHFSIPTVL